MRISDWSSDVCSSDLARATVAGIRQPISLANQFGVIDVDPKDNVRIRDFLEKPQNPTGLSDRSEERRVGKECVSRVDLGGRRIIKKKKYNIILIKKKTNTIPETVA